jgi:hypothetical protein
MTEKSENNHDNLEQDSNDALSNTNSSIKEMLQKIKWLERSLHKGKISQELYDSESKTIKEAIDKAELSNMQKEFEEFSGRPNPTMTIKDGHIVIKLICPHCKTEGENSHGKIQFKILGKDRNGYLYFKCPVCQEHLQYDPATGNIKTRKGLLGVLFGRFS